MRFFKLIVVVFATLFVTRLAGAGAPTCKSVFQIPIRALPFETTALSLSALQRQEARLATSGQVRRINSTTVKLFGDYKPELPAIGGRGTEVEYSQLQKLLEILKNDAVVGRANRERYQQPSAEIGFCFGRALYVQLMLLKMGLNPDSIRKVWLVGPQRNPDGANWGFHVATAAYVRGFGWMAIDTNTFKIQELRHWYSHFYENSIDGLARFYVTDAKRFTTEIDAISLVQLGLDLPIEKDWYRHYFVHMLSGVRAADIGALGLQPIQKNSKDPKPVVAKKPSAESTWLTGMRDFIGL